MAESETIILCLVTRYMRQSEEDSSQSLGKGMGEEMEWQILMNLVLAN